MVGVLDFASFVSGGAATIKTTRLNSISSPINPATSTSEALVLGIEPIGSSSFTFNDFLVVGTNWGQSATNAIGKGPAFTFTFKCSFPTTSSGTISINNLHTHRRNTNGPGLNYEDELYPVELRRVEAGGSSMFTILASRRPGSNTTGGTENYPLRNSNDFLNIQVQSLSFSGISYEQQNGSYLINWNPKAHTLNRSLGSPSNPFDIAYVVGNMNDINSYSHGQFSEIGVFRYTTGFSPTRQNDCQYPQSLQFVPQTVPVNPDQQSPINGPVTHFTEYQDYDDFSESILVCYGSESESNNQKNTSKTQSFDNRLNVSNMKIYPNPAFQGSTLYVELTSESETINDVKLYEITGKMVTTRASVSINNENSSFTISTDGLIPGIYLLQVQSGRTYMYEKVLIR